MPALPAADAPGAMRRPVLRLVRAIDALNAACGRALRWGVLVIPLITVGYTLVRKLTHWGHNGVSEAQWFVFAWVYMGCAGYTLLRGQHVRVDVLASHLPWRWRSRVEIALHLLLWPPLLYLCWHFWWFWLASAAAPDGPEDVLTGLQRWPLKLAMFTGCALLWLQSLAEVLRQAARLRGWLPPMPAHGHG